MLKSQDVLVTVTILALQRAGERPSYASLAQQCQLSTSDTHGAVRRAKLAGLLAGGTNREAGMGAVVRASLTEFLCHGAAYVWPLQKSGVARGMATAHSLASLQERLHVIAPASPLVWPHPEGTLRGESIEPLHRAVPAVAAVLPLVHEMFALIDLIRLRDNRLTNLAVTALTATLRE